MSILIFLDPFIDYKVLRYSCDLIHMRDVNMNVSQMKPLGWVAPILGDKMPEVREACEVCKWQE